MVIITIFLYITLMLYIILKRSELTIFVLALIFSMVYFYPSLFGYTSLMDKNYQIIKIPIDLRVYYIYWTIFLLLFLSDVIYCKVKLPKFILGRKFKEININYFINILFLINTGIFLYYIFILNIRFLDNKIYIAHLLGQLFLVFQTLVIIFFVSSIVYKKRFSFSLSLVFLIWMLIIGFRTPIVIALISFLIVKFVNGKKIKFIKYVIPAFLAGILVFASKPFYTEFSQSRNLYESLINSFFSIETYIHELQFSEPFVTQSILNFTVIYNYRLESFYVTRWISRMLTGTSKLSFSDDFHEQFVYTFLPGIDYGIAYNIWAEIYAVGDVALVMIFIILYLVILLVIQILLIQTSGVFRICIAVVGAFWTFYLHRNNLENMILFTQVVLIPIFFIYLSSQLIENKKHRNR